MTARADDVPRLAIACQGGGAHTAFTAGVLAYLFLSFEHFRREGQENRWFRLQGLSGTSGGALTAALAWSKADSWATGASRVLHYWNRNKASLDLAGKAPLWWGDYFTNKAAQFALSLQDWLPDVSVPPSPFLSALVQARMKDDLRATVGLSAGAERFFGRDGLDLFVGAVDVLGYPDHPQSAFRTFPERPGAGIRLDELLASACIPELFVAGPLEVDSRSRPGHREPRFFWDGLYSQNPPINDFFINRPRDDKPDLLWVVQINPNQYEGSACGPVTPSEQIDRRNELSGNLSLGQELRSIDVVNKIATQLTGLRKLPPELADYKRVTVSVVGLGERPRKDFAGVRLDYASKLNRDPAFIDALIAEGIAAAAEAACGGQLLQPHPSMSRQHCRCDFSNPDWPDPRDLAAFLADDPALARQWAALTAAG
ncbi:MAG: patatin-like phospholipase family protein [Proteobacteria bacterium]|nr:patatin-like phospholipase family protein [Pseudomonadota bacterium]